MTIKQSSPAAKTTKSFEESLWDTANRTMPTNNTSNGEIRPKLTEARIKRMSSSGNVIQTLATLRDRLLPELISGELRVSEAEQLTEKALA